MTPRIDRRMSHTIAVLDARDEARGCQESIFAYQASEQGVMVPCSINFFSIQAGLRQNI